MSLEEENDLWLRALIQYVLESRDSETNRQSRFDALYRMLGAGALG